MISKNLYFNIIIRVMLIVMFSLLLGYFALINQSLRFSIIFFIAIVFLTISLISYLNLTNKKIRFFFDSVRNDDSNLSFPVDIKERSFRELYQSMNRAKYSYLLRQHRYRKLTRVPEPVKKLFKMADLLSRLQILYSSLEKSDRIDLSFSLKDPDLEIFADQNLIS